MSDTMRETETMCRLFLELSQFVPAKTARELQLEAAQADARALVGELEKSLRDSEQLLQDAQDIMRSNIIPNGISDKDAIAAYIALLDNTRQRRVQTATHQALIKTHAFMEDVCKS